MGIEEVILGDRQKSELTTISNNAIYILDKYGTLGQYSSGDFAPISYSKGKLKIEARKSTRGYESLTIKYKNDIKFDAVLLYEEDLRKTILRVDMFDRGDWMDSLDRKVSE